MVVARRHDISRLEGFSDAVFGFALTLLGAPGPGEPSRVEGLS